MEGGTPAIVRMLSGLTLGIILGGAISAVAALRDPLAGLLPSEASRDTFLWGARQVVALGWWVPPVGLGILGAVARGSGGGGSRKRRRRRDL